MKIHSWVGGFLSFKANTVKHTTPYTMRDGQVPETVLFLDFLCFASYFNTGWIAYDSICCDDVFYCDEFGNSGTL